MRLFHVEPSVMRSSRVSRDSKIGLYQGLRLRLKDRVAGVAVVHWREKRKRKYVLILVLRRVVFIVLFKSAEDDKSKGITFIEDFSFRGIQTDCTAGKHSVNGP